MDRLKKKTKNRWRRHKHIRHNVVGTEERPRLCVFRSTKHIYCQIIDDKKGQTLCTASTLTKELSEAIQQEKDKAKNEKKKFSKTQVASLVGDHIAKKAQEKGLKKVSFDRAGFKYHGRIKALADAARKGGLEF